MTDLIERLELTGPDRGLDSHIYLVAIGQRGFDREYKHSIFSRNLDEWCRTGEIWQVADNYKIPRYTASIDAALTLVPKWHKWSVACGRPVQYVARVTPTKSDHGCSDGECDSTPAIALCIAALKARAALTSLPRRGGEP